MGWKNLKTAYNINHHVTMNDEYILIGSEYVRNIVTIHRKTGVIRENPTFRGFLDDHYPALTRSSATDRLRHLHNPDRFKANIPVYTFADGKVIQSWCETPGYPNVTHEGKLMITGYFSTDRDTVVGWAKRELEDRMEKMKEREEVLRDELADLRRDLQNTRARFTVLSAEAHPDYAVSTQPATDDA